MPRLPDPELNRKWQTLLRLQRESQLSVALFCQQHNVSTASFYQWRKKLQQKQPTAADHSGSFLPVHVAPPADARCLTVQFASGTVMQLNDCDSDSLRLVVDRLAQGSASREVLQ